MQDIQKRQYKHKKTKWKLKSYRPLAIVSAFLSLCIVLGVFSFWLLPAEADMQSLWRTLQGTGANAVVTDDIDGDNISEAIMAGKDGHIYIRKYNTETRLTEPYPVYNISTGLVPDIIELRDINGDGKKDIIVAGSTSNKVEAYSFVNNNLAQIFSVQLDANVIDITTGQLTDKNGTTGIDVAAITQDNKIEIIYNNSGSWQKAVNISIGHAPMRIEAFKYYGTADPKDAMVVTTESGVRTFPFTSVDNPDPLWIANNIDFSYYGVNDGGSGWGQKDVTYTVFGPLAISRDIVKADNTNGTDGVPEIVVGTQQQIPWRTDCVMTLNGKNGQVVWQSKGGSADVYTNLGRINDIKVQSIDGSGTPRYIVVGTGPAKDLHGNPYDANYVLLFDLNGSGNGSARFLTISDLQAGEVLSVYQGHIDHKLTGTNTTQLSALIGSGVSGDRHNQVRVWNWNGSSLSGPGANQIRQLDQALSYTWSPRSTYWIDEARINPQDNWRDIVFIHPGIGGAEAVSFDNKAPTVISFTPDPNPVVNPWYNNMTFSINADEASYVRVEILDGNNALVRDLGWRVADFNGTTAHVSFTWDGKYAGGNNYDQNSYKARVTLVDNELQFIGSEPLNIPENNENTSVTVYGPHDVEIDNVLPQLSLNFYKDAQHTEPLMTYEGKPAINSGKPVYIRVEPIAPETMATLDTNSVFFTVYDIHVKERTQALVDYSMGVFKGTWPLTMPAQNGEATVTVEGLDPGGNFGTVTAKVLVDNQVTVPEVTVNNTIFGKIVLNIGGTDPDHHQVKIYRSNVSGFAPDDEANLLKTINAPAFSSYEDKLVKPEHTYYYRVKQKDKAGNEALSPEIAATAVPALTFSLDYYEDSALTQALPKRTDGKYSTGLRNPIYVKFTANNNLISSPTFMVGAPDSNNSIPSPAPTEWVSGKVYKGVWGVVNPAQNGMAEVKVTATDIHTQTITNDVPASGGKVIIDTLIKAPKLKGYPGPASVELNWAAENDLYQTKIYRSTTAGFTPVDSGTGKNLIATATGGVYHDPNLLPGQDYYYRVRAVDYAGNISDPSNVIKVNPEETGPHPPPVIERAETTSKQLLYLVFDEPVRITGDPTTWVISQNGEGTPPEVVNAEVTDDRKVIKVLLSDSQGPGNLLNPLTYTITLTDVEDYYGSSLAQDGQANQISWEAFTPHGKFANWSEGRIPAGSSTALCGLCHSTHNAVGTQLLVGTTIKKVCFVCHGTTGSSVYLVEEEFVDRSVYGMPYSSYLHKALDADDEGYDILTCADCHNPHGDVIDKNTGNVIYPKLLRAADGAGNKYYKGNQFCFACHGKDDHGYEDGIYYENTGGNHISYLYPGNINAPKSPGPVHYDNFTFAGYLNPTSGTEITCIMCHERHGSKYQGMLDNNLPDGQEGMCFKSGCHGPENSAKNVYDDFYGTEKVSRHEVDGASGRGNVECSSCHGPHTVARNNSSTVSRISDPDNTKLPFTNASGDRRVFCIRCHDGDPPLQVRDATRIVPYNVIFNDIGFTSNSGGWDKKDFPLSGHGKTSYSVANCGGCHKSHGSEYPWLLRWEVDTTLTNSGFNNNSGCLGLCHKEFNVGGGGTHSGIYLPYTSTYTHPTFTVNGVHSNTEKWSDKNVSRHAECVDCHDVHTGIANGTETGVNGRVTGVHVADWNGATWDNWASTVPIWTLGGLEENSGQWQLCFKCHSKYSYNLVTVGGDVKAPHNNLSVAGYRQTDIAREFNPNNPAYHAVVGPSKMPAGYGKFVNGWSHDSKLKCTDCHSYHDTGAARGPHGSNYPFILKKPWYPENAPAGRGPTGSGNGDQNDLCFDCHDYSFYLGEDRSTVSQFSGNRSNMHHGKCASCHGGLPHGWKYTDSAGGGLSLVKATDPFPYSQGVWLGTVSLRFPNSTPGTWHCSDCHIKKPEAP